MPVIQNYKIVRDSVRNISSFETQVNDFLSKGWQPVGEMKIVQIDKVAVLIQQLVQYSTECEKNSND